MLLTTGILAGLIAVGAASPASIGPDNRGRWSISCDQSNKCGYVQTGSEVAHGKDNALNRRELIPVGCEHCKQAGLFRPGRPDRLDVQCVDPASDGACLGITGLSEDIAGSSKTNTTGFTLSLLRRDGGLPLYGPESPDHGPGAQEHSPNGSEHKDDKPAYEGAPQSPGDYPNGPPPVGHGPGAPKPSSGRPYAAVPSTTSGYGPAKPISTAAKPSAGPPHGPGKPTGPPSSSTRAYVKPGKPSQGPESPPHGPPTQGPGSYPQGPEGHGPSNPTPVVVTTFVTYDKPTPVHGKPSSQPESPAHGPPEDKQPPHGSGKPTQGPPAAISAYTPPGTVGGKPSYGPDKPPQRPVASTTAYGPPTPPTSGPEKPSEKKYPGKPEEESSSPKKPAGGKLSGARPTGAKPTAGKPQSGIPAPVKPAGKDAVSKKPIPYVEFDEAECIDCEEGDPCYDECDWMFACGQKKKCFHNGARDIFEICYEKGQKCEDEEHGGYDKPEGESKSYGKP
ncbi:hypothetical protein T440DRAFT_373969, partial [Plenodomus tracheiphilus IPT5]